MEELTAIEEEIAALEKIAKYARKRKIQIYYKNYPHLKENLLRSLLNLKEELIKLGVKSSEESILERTNDFLYVIGELQANIEETKTETIEENIREMKNIFSELRALTELQILLSTRELGLGINLERIPEEIKTEVATDIEEIGKCYSSGAYRAAIVFCGRMLETALARAYFEKTRVDPIKHRWTLGELVKRCKKIGIFQPGLGELCEVVNKIRIPSVHKSADGIYMPTPQETVGVFHLVQSVLQKLW